MTASPPPVRAERTGHGVFATSHHGAERGGGRRGDAVKCRDDGCSAPADGGFVGMVGGD